MKKRTEIFSPLFTFFNKWLSASETLHWLNLVRRENDYRKTKEVFKPNHKPFLLFNKCRCICA